MSSSSWGLQVAMPVIGTEAVPVTLTTSYADQTSPLLSVAGVQKITFYIQYTASTATNNIQFEILGSGLDPLPAVTPKEYQFTNSVNSAGATTITAQEITYAAPGTSANLIRYDVLVNDKQIQFKMKETLTGGGAAGTASVYALISANQ